MRFQQLAGMGLAALAALPLGAMDAPDAGSDESAMVSGESVGAVSLVESSAAPLFAGGTRAKGLPVHGEGNYPVAALRRRQEGWVSLGVCVTPAGEVVDPIIEDSSGVGIFEQAALKELRDMRFEPATWQGKPVEQCMQLHVEYRLKGRTGARRSFLRRFREADSLLSAGQLDEAQARLDALGGDGTWTLYEASWLELARANLAQRRGDLEGAALHLQRATRKQGEYINNRKAYRAAIQQLFQLQVATGQYGEAMDTWTDLKKLDPPPDDARGEELAGKLQDLIESPQLLVFDGEIRQRRNDAKDPPYWEHKLLRRKFGFETLEGKVDEFWLRCDWKQIRGRVDTDVVLELPQEQAGCQVFVFGDIGARIRLVEYPEPLASGAVLPEQLGGVAGP